MYYKDNNINMQTCLRVDINDIFNTALWCMYILQHSGIFKHIRIKKYAYFGQLQPITAINGFICLCRWPINLVHYSIYYYWLYLGHTFYQHTFTHNAVNMLGCPHWCIHYVISYPFIHPNGHLCQYVYLYLGFCHYVTPPQCPFACTMRYNMIPFHKGW